MLARLIHSTYGVVCEIAHAIHRDTAYSNVFRAWTLRLPTYNVHNQETWVDALWHGVQWEIAHDDGDWSRFMYRRNYEHGQSVGTQENPPGRLLMLKYDKRGARYGECATAPSFRHYVYGNEHGCSYMRGTWFNEMRYFCWRGLDVANAR